MGYRRPQEGFNPLPNGAVSAPWTYHAALVERIDVSIPFLTGPCLLQVTMKQLEDSFLEFQSPS